MVLFNKCVHINFLKVINSKEKMLVYKDDLIKIASIIFSDIDVIHRLCSLDLLFQ